MASSVALGISRRVSSCVRVLSKALLWAATVSRPEKPDLLPSAIKQRIVEAVCSKLCIRQADPIPQDLILRIPIPVQGHAGQVDFTEIDLAPELPAASDAPRRTCRPYG